MATPNRNWPELPLDAWHDSYQTVHLWTQIVGKIRLAHTPWINHSWHVALYVTAQGLTTSLMSCGTRGFEIELDFIDHRLRIATSDGDRRSFALEPMPVARFHAQLERALAELDLTTHIMPLPVEIPDPIIPFPRDTEHRSYDPAAVRRFWQALLQAQRVFTDFRARFVGKTSPVHFFWGAFDLAVTRFSGRPAPRHPGGAPNCADWVMEEAYSHEVSSAGFWPGAGLGEAAFYAYAYPQPEGFSEHPVRPESAYYHAELGEFVLPYEAVRKAANPDADLLDFLQTTYEAAAENGKWDRAALERAHHPGPGRP